EFHWAWRRFSLEPIIPIRLVDRRRREQSLQDAPGRFIVRFKENLRQAQWNSGDAATNHRLCWFSAIIKLNHPSISTGYIWRPACTLNHAKRGKNEYEIEAACIAAVGGRFSVCGIAIFDRSWH